MPIPLAPPDAPADLRALIARDATEEPDGRALPEALNRLGVPVSRMSIGAPSISPVHRGITLVRRRGLGVALTPTVHGPEGTRNSIGASMQPQRGPPRPRQPRSRGRLQPLPPGCEAEPVDLGTFPLREVTAEQRLRTVAEA